MAEPHLGPLEPFTTIGQFERGFVLDSLKHPLSGYIGGNPKAGRWVAWLASQWSDTFGVAHAIPCNSATSGLLAACMAAGVGPGDVVWTTPYSMSATAACAKVLGAKVFFADIETDRFGIDPEKLGDALPPKAIIVTNLFGHPAYLRKLRQWCDARSVILIEDNAQAPMATEDGVYTGTIGHIGVFSLNVHKHIQCGEGGVVVTADDDLAAGIEGAINHGELSLDHPITGLNLRMTEPIAAIACAQVFYRAKDTIEGRRQIGLELCDMVKDVPWIEAHGEQLGCKHVYYLWTAVVGAGMRGDLLRKLNESGVPIRGGYAPLLNKLFRAYEQPCPVAYRIDSKIIVFEVCAWDLPQPKRDTMREIFKQVTGELHEDRVA